LFCNKNIHLNKVKFHAGEQHAGKQRNFSLLTFIYTSAKNDKQTAFALKVSKSSHILRTGGNKTD